MAKTLASILRPISISEFCSDYYSKKPLYIEDGPEKFEKVFSWESLNRILNSAPVPHPTMKMVLEGKLVIPTDAASIIQRCREGASLVIEEIHKYDACVGKLAAELSAEISEPTRVNLYLSQPSRQGYSRHYDTHDVFILQIEGYKGWRIFDFTVEHPLFVQKTHGANAPTMPRLECTLKPGDVLYIPRGHWHEATAQVEPSLHLTLGIYARTGIDFLLWLTDELREDVRWRETFPLKPREPGETAKNDVVSDLEHFEKLKRLLVSKINDRSLLQEYRKFCIAQERRVEPFSFPSHVVEVPPISESTAFSRPVYQQVFVERDDSGMVEVTIWGQVLKFSGPVEEILQYIFSTHVFTGKEACESSPDLSWTDIAKVLRCLLQERVIEIVKA